MSLSVETPWFRSVFWNETCICYELETTTSLLTRKVTVVNKETHTKKRDRGDEEMHILSITKNTIANKKSTVRAQIGSEVILSTEASQS